MLWKLSLHITKEIRVGVFRRAACSRNLKKLMLKLTYQKNILRIASRAAFLVNVWKSYVFVFARILSLSLSESRSGTISRF